MEKVEHFFGVFMYNAGSTANLDSGLPDPYNNSKM